MIRKRRQQKLEGLALGNRSLLDHMIEISENNAEFTEDAIIDEVCTFMLAVSLICLRVMFSVVSVIFNNSIIHQIIIYSTQLQGPRLGRRLIGIFDIFISTTSAAPGEVYS